MEGVSGEREIGRREGAKEGERLRKGKREGKGRGSHSNISLGVEQPNNSSVCTQTQPSRGAQGPDLLIHFCLILVTYCSGFIYSPCD